MKNLVKEEVHIGRVIEQILHEQGRTVTWFAETLSYDRSNIYKIFRKKGIDTTLLMRISLILNYNFFYHFICNGENESAANAESTYKKNELPFV